MTRLSLSPSLDFRFLDFSRTFELSQSWHRRVAYSMTTGCEILFFLALFDISHDYPHRAVYRLALDARINFYCVLLEFRWAMGFCHLS
jgi:hypothetical protein